MSDVQAANSEDGAPEPAPEPGAAPEASEADPAVAEVGQAAAEEPAPQPDPEAPEGDPLEGQPEPPEPESVEVEINGLKYRVPAALKDGYLMQADYTTKTMDLAGKGRELDGDREALKTDRDTFTQQAQTHRENIQDFGELAHTEKMLGGFRSMTQVDWDGIRQKDQEDGTGEYERYRLQFDLLRDTHTQIVERIRKREYETGIQEEQKRVTAERENVNRKDQLQATLARDIPNYSPVLQTKMNETAIRHGFTQADLDSVTDPKMMRMLHLAHLGEQVLQRKRAATTQPAPAPVKPVPKVGGGTTPTTGPTDKQGIKAWMDSREQQLKRGTV